VNFPPISGVYPFARGTATLDLILKAVQNAIINGNVFPNQTNVSSCIIVGAEIDDDEVPFIRNDSYCIISLLDEEADQTWTDGGMYQNAAVGTLLLHSRINVRIYNRCGLDEQPVGDSYLKDIGLGITTLITNLIWTLNMYDSAYFAKPMRLLSRSRIKRKMIAGNNQKATNSRYVPFWAHCDLVFELDYLQGPPEGFPLSEAYSSGNYPLYNQNLAAPMGINFNGATITWTDPVWSGITVYQINIYYNGILKAGVLLGVETYTFVSGLTPGEAFFALQAVDVTGLPGNFAYINTTI
jgi:hypothetical protein